MVVSPERYGHCRSKFEYRREFRWVAIIVTVGNNIPAVCICGNDGSNDGFAKIIIYLNDFLASGTVVSCDVSMGPPVSGMMEAALAPAVRIPPGQKGMGISVMWCVIGRCPPESAMMDVVLAPAVKIPPGFG